jgi:uncharacterized small protein (DUF1192 family)
MHIPRLRIGLRLMLLWVAIFAVCAAYIRAKMDLEREEKEYKQILFAQSIYQMQHRRNEWANLIRDRAGSPLASSSVPDLDKRIAAMQKQLDRMKAE